MLRKWSFVIALAGISFFVFLLFIGNYHDVSDVKELGSMELHTKVVLEGEVVSERVFDDFRILEVNGVDVVCNCKKSYLERVIRVEGLVSEFNGKRQIKALSIGILE